ncbi:MAG: DNA polymerase/3'-5' exonuclease PolX [Candidatus Eisenbacteria bacterium]
MKNREIAEIFELLADVLEIKDESVFRVNAYRRVARILGDLPSDVAGLVESREILGIQGVGKGTADAIAEYLETGAISQYERERKSIPRGLVELLSIPGLGPKTIGLLWRELDVKSLKSLKRILRGKKILELPGIGPKKVENIEAGIRVYESRSGRLTLGTVLPAALATVDELKEATGIDQVEVAGSIRRWRETIGDIDILALSSKPRLVIEAFTNLPRVTEVLAAGSTKASVRVADGLQMDLRVVPPSVYGAALMYFTGSQAHNVHLRGLAQSKGLKLSEYGLFKGDRRVAARTEESIYKKLGMEYVEPELREDRGEVEAALEGTLPELVELSDIRGDLHVHSNYSDGHSTIEDVARAAKARGYKYVSINDHSHSLGVAHGLTVERLLEQAEEIAQVNERVNGIAVFSGTEADILSDGRVDFPDEVLESLDIVVASIHSGFQQSSDRITGRMISAIENPHVDIIGHPTGRLLGTRPAYDVDLERVMSAAADSGTALEINSHHERLDLNDVNARRAAEMGVRVAISTDCHHVDQMWMMELGVRTARRGWLDRGNVLNTLTPKALLRSLSKG